MRKWINLVESMRASSYLYHTTSAYAAVEILRDKEIKPKNYESFVSMSTLPLHTGDISATDVTLIFNKIAIQSQLLEVDYDVEWYHEYRAQAAYIAGEGWIEQFHYDGDIDDDGFTDEDDEAEQYSNAEMDSFMDKADENEWISAVAGKPVVFGSQDVCGVILKSRLDSVEEWTAELAQLGYAGVPVKARTP